MRAFVPHCSMYVSIGIWSWVHYVSVMMLKKGVWQYNFCWCCNGSSRAGKCPEAGTRKTESILLVFLSFMRKELQQHGLDYWIKANDGVAHVSLSPFNNLSKSSFACQASSTTANRVFSDLGLVIINQPQSPLFSTMEMMEIVSSFVKQSTKSCQNVQNTLLHPEAKRFIEVGRDISQLMSFTDSKGSGWNES